MVVHCIRLCACHGKLEFCVGTKIKWSNFINCARPIDLCELDRVVDIVNYFGRRVNVGRVFFVTVLAKGEMEPERKETRNKVDEDRKHEYPFNCFGPLASRLPLVVPFCGSVDLFHNESSFFNANIIITYVKVHFDLSKT